MTTFVRSSSHVPWHISRSTRQQGPATEHKTYCGSSVFLNAKGRPEAEIRDAVAMGAACLWCMRAVAKERKREPMNTTIPLDDINRCCVCGWPLKSSPDAGCVRGNCSQRLSVDGKNMEK